LYVQREVGLSELSMEGAGVVELPVEGAAEGLLDEGPAEGLVIGDTVGGKVFSSPQQSR
jgi:hypothetical protein